jgi:hypothetical protein
MKNEISDLKEKEYENQDDNVQKKITEKKQDLKNNQNFNQNPDLNQDFVQSKNQNQNIKEENTKEKESYEVKTTNFIFSSMIALVIVGTIQIILNINKFLEPLKKNNPKYEFPSIYDFKITIIALPIFCVKK